MAAIQGRLRDSDGKPLADAVVRAAYRERDAAMMHQLMHASKRVVTDANGVFTLDELISELQFDLLVQRGKQRFEREAKPAERAIQVKPGESRDLGEIRTRQTPTRPQR